MIPFLLRSVQQTTYFCLAWAVWLLTSCSVSSPSTSSGTDEINLRFVNLSPGAVPFSLLLNGEEVTPRLGFQGFSDYVAISSGAYDLSLKAASRALNQAIPAGSEIGSRFVEFEGERKTFSILAVEEPERVTLLTLEENEPPEFSKAKVRFVNAVPQSNNFEWINTRDNKVLAPAAGFGEVTPYQTMDPGAFSMAATHEGQLFDQYDFSLESFRVYTVYTTGLLSGDPEIELVLVEESRADELL